MGEHTTWRRVAASVLIALALTGAACSSDDDKKSAATTTTTANGETTTTEVQGAVIRDRSTTTTTAGATVRTTTTRVSGGTTVSTTRTVEIVGATVTDAPREAHEEKSDGGGTFTFGVNPPSATASTEAKTNDPLEFLVTCTVMSDGHGTCKLKLVNHVTRTAQFPDGLSITLVMVKRGGDTTEFAHKLPSITALKAGETAEIDATFDLNEHGTYDYTAKTVVAWP